MGYNTTYEFTLTGPTEAKDGAREAFICAEAAKGYNALRRAQAARPAPLSFWEALRNRSSWDSVEPQGCHGKWYDYANDIRAVFATGHWPDTVLVVSGVGEEFPDVWRHRFSATGDERIVPLISWPEFTDEVTS